MKGTQRWSVRTYEFKFIACMDELMCVCIA